MARHDKAPSPGKVPTGTILTKHLRALAVEAEDSDSSGTPITKAQKLATLVWKHALGFEEIDPKTGTRAVVKPQTWAIVLIYERLEGRAPVAMEGEKGGSLSDRVSDLGRMALNGLIDDPKAIKE